MTETKDLAHALAVLMTRLPEIKKTQNADIRTDKTRYRYTYADLADVSRAILPILGELGLSFTARPTVSNGQFVLAYRLLHVSGEDDKGEYPLPASGGPQVIGAAITYARRYCLCAVTGVAPEDDDDGAAAQAEDERNRGNGRSAWRAPTSKQAPTGGDRPASNPQLQKLHELFGQAAWTDKADRQRAVSAMVGREIGSATELTRDEASTAIEKLQQITADPDPAVRLSELVSGLLEIEGGGE